MDSSGIYALKTEHDRRREIVYVHELTSWSSASPDRNSVHRAFFRIVKFTNERRDHVGCFSVEVVIRSIQVGRCQCVEIRPVLTKVTIAQLETGDLCDGVGFIRRLEVTGQQLFLRYRLDRFFRIHTRAAEED